MKNHSFTIALSNIIIFYDFKILIKIVTEKKHVKFNYYVLS